MNHEMQHTPASKPNNYVPLITIVAIIIACTMTLAINVGWSAQTLLGLSMGLFFVLFGMFKLLDLANFAMGYQEYDLIAKFFPGWGYIYPFLELAIGFLYLSGANYEWLNCLTIGLSVLICTGVGIKLAKHEVVQCACLGSILKVPITFVSLTEYAIMAAMAAVMLYI